MSFAIIATKLDHPISKQTTIFGSNMGRVSLVSSLTIFILFLYILFNFCGFSMGRNQYWAGWIYDLCVYYMTGAPEGSTESGFMEKPGIEPATPGLQGITLIHYTTGASLFYISFLGQK